MESHGSGSPSELLERVDADPRGTKDEAQRRIASSLMNDHDRAELAWVIGMCDRELGDLVAAGTAMEEAITGADLVGDEVLAARVRLSLSTVAGRQGDLDRALALAVEVQRTSLGPVRAAARLQLGVVRYWRGEFTEAAEQLKVACSELSRLDERPRELRARMTLGVVLSQRGELEQAMSQTRRAIEIAEELGQHVDVGLARGNLGYIAMLEGDLPGAIGEYERAERLLTAAGAETYLPQLHAAHGQALGQAALFDDAVNLVHRALDMLQHHGNDIEIAGTLIKLAEIRLAQGEIENARVAAEEASKWYRKHGRERWLALADFVARQAAARAGPVDVELARSLVDVAEALASRGLTSEANRAQLYAAKIRGDANATDGIDPVPPNVRRDTLCGRASDRILLAHIDALVAGERQDRTAIRRAITRGLRAVTSNQAALGSIETRAHAAVHGYALTEIGARLAVEDRRPRELLERIEATRMMSSRLPALRPPVDPDMAAMLTELRTINGAIADGTSTDDQRAEAERARIRVERDVRRRSRTVRGDAAAFGVRDELGSALAMLGDRQLLAYAALDGRLFAVSVVSRRARLHELGELEGVSEMIGEIAFSLNRLNRAQGSEASRTAAAEMLYMVADELAEHIVPDVIARAMDPVIVVPTAVLHDAPWGLLPPLGGRAVSINPSVSAWARAERTRRERVAVRTGRRAVGFMAGPGLEFAELEVEHLAVEYIDPEVFTGEEATGAACVDLLGRADLVHIACHGSFRTDNPMFSSLHLVDGALIVHDLERIERLPETVILPACSVAGTKVLQGGSVLGLANALMTLGACNVIAPLTPINDASSVTVMQRLHRELVSGTSPAAALAAATMAHDLADPTAAAFISLGA